MAEENTIAKVVRLKKIVRNSDLTQCSPSDAIVITGLLINDGLHAVAESIERLDIESALGDVANALHLLDDIGPAIEKVADALAGLPRG